jgi:hypothetical protein
MNNTLIVSISWGERTERHVDNGEESNLDIRLSFPPECIDQRYDGEPPEWFAEARAMLATYRSHTQFPFIDGDVFVEFGIEPGDPIDTRWAKTMNGAFVNDWIKVLMFHAESGKYHVTYNVCYDGQIEPLMVRRIDEG